MVKHTGAMRWRSTRLGRRGVFLLAAAVAAGCGRDAEPEPVTPETVPADTVAPAAPVAAPADEIAEVGVVLREWSLVLERDSIGPGAVTFRIVNEGTVDHALLVRSGEEEWETEPVPPGGSVRMSVHLGAGDYDVYCPLQREGVQHADLGMTGRLRVR